MPELPQDIAIRVKQQSGQLVPPGVVPGTRLTFLGPSTDDVGWTSEPDEQIRSGNGDPNGVQFAPKGTLYEERGTPALWQNTDGVATWVIVGTGSGIAISDLDDAATPLVGDELVPIVQDGDTVKTTVSEFGGGGGYWQYGVEGANRLDLIPASLSGINDAEMSFEDDLYIHGIRFGGFVNPTTPGQNSGNSTFRRYTDIVAQMNSDYDGGIAELWLYSWLLGGTTPDQNEFADTIWEIGGNAGECYIFGESGQEADGSGGFSDWEIWVNSGGGSAPEAFFEVAADQTGIFSNSATSGIWMGVGGDGAFVMYLPDAPADNDMLTEESGANGGRVGIGLSYNTATNVLTFTASDGTSHALTLT